MRLLLAVCAGIALCSLGVDATGLRTVMPEGCPTRERPPPCFLELLKCGAWFFEKHAIPYRIDGGTLIGQARSGVFIPWDDDIDVAVDTSTTGMKLDPQIISAFAAEKAAGTADASCANVTHIEYKSKTDENMRMKHNQCKHCNWGSPQWLDIDNEHCAGSTGTQPPGSKFSKDPLDGSVLDSTKPSRADKEKQATTTYCDWPWEQGNRRKVTYAMLRPTVPCTLEGVQVKCPAKTDEYLKMYYGSDWQSPSYTAFKDGHWLKDEKVVAGQIANERASKASYNAYSSRFQRAGEGEEEGKEDAGATGSSRRRGRTQGPSWETMEHDRASVEEAPIPGREGRILEKIDEMLDREQALLH